MAFAIFLPVAFFSYWAIPSRWRWVQLLAVSYYFYLSFNARYVLIILFTTALSYSCALRIEAAQNARSKKRWLALLLAGSLGVLFVFKYFNFFAASALGALNAMAIPVSPVMLRLALPVGISFYTFQTIGYVADVYRGIVPAEHHFGYYAVFVSFFPQLAAGPIARAGDLLPQIRREHTFDDAQAGYGLKRMAWGFFKKLLLADGAAQYVDVVYNDIAGHQGFAIIVATFLFAIQIYCDFSGYSDIAQGTAMLFGIELTTNFKSPYFSGSVKEFWSRWHISLSSWLRDYVYIPLGGNRCGKLRHAFNLMATFLVSGLWHGANWTYVVWGALHGAAQIVETAVPALRAPSKTAAGRCARCARCSPFASAQRRGRYFGPTRWLTWAGFCAACSQALGLYILTLAMPIISWAFMKTRRS